MRWLRAAAIAATIWGAHPGSCMHVHHFQENLPNKVLGESGDCTIIYDRRQWSWGKYCTTTIHEWGHLAGRNHSRNPRSVMYFRFNHVDRRCNGSR